MRYFLLLLPFVHTIAQAQEESTVSISCYVNPELYIQASVVAQVTDEAGKVSCNGKYVSFSNRSKNTFYYNANKKWVALKPQAKATVSGSVAGVISSASPSVFKINVKYKRDISGSMAARITKISEMNAQTDQVQARELAALKKPVQSGKQPSAPASAKVDNPGPPESPKPAPEVEQQDKPESAPEKKTVVAKTRSQPGSKRTRPQATPARRSGVGAQNQSPTNAIGLRVDVGNGVSGLGPNYKHKLNRNLSLDAAIVFFEDNLVGLGAQVEQAYPLKGAPGLNWYIGIGPQLLLAEESTSIALVPVTGLEYALQGSPLNISVDWRPNFYLSPGANVDAGRFGLSLRLAF